MPEDGVNSMNAYDNTVRETDEYVARATKRSGPRRQRVDVLHERPRPAVGEGGAFFNHGYQENVVRNALLVFPPPSSPRAHWNELAAAPVAACDLAPTFST